MWPLGYNSTWMLENYNHCNKPPLERSWKWCSTNQLTVTLWAVLDRKQNVLSSSWITWMGGIVNECESMVSVQEDTSGSKVFVFLLSHLSQCYKRLCINVLLGQSTCPTAVPTCPTAVPTCPTAVPQPHRDTSGTARDTSVVPDKRLYTNV